MDSLNILMRLEINHHSISFIDHMQMCASNLLSIYTQLQSATSIITRPQLLHVRQDHCKFQDSICEPLALLSCKVFLSQCSAFFIGQRVTQIMHVSHADDFHTSTQRCNHQQKNNNTHNAQLCEKFPIGCYLIVLHKVL